VVPFKRRRPETPEGMTGVLSSGRVVLEESVDDLEVRVYVGADDEVRLDGYELVPVRDDPERSMLEAGGG